MSKGLYSAKTLTGLSVGDVVEAGQLFPNLSSEPLTFEYLGRVSGEWQFRVSYCGVYLGHTKLLKSETNGRRTIIGSMIDG